MLIRKQKSNIPLPQKKTHIFFKILLRLGTLLGTNMSPPKVWFENNVPFPVLVGYVSFLGASS